jgi:CHAT domain-containing protein/tetratricopeptide (TPR) repeat protein
MQRLKIYLAAILLSVSSSFAVMAIAPTIAIGGDRVTNSSLQEAQTLNRQGAAYLAAGRADLALQTWQQAFKIYTTLQDREGIIGTQINQAQALQSLGSYRQAVIILRTVELKLATEPNSPIKARALLSLGNTLKSLRVFAAKTNPATGASELGAQETLDRALKIALAIPDPVLADQIELSLVNTLALTSDRQDLAQQTSIATRYRSVRDRTTSPLLRVQAQLNLYRLESIQNPNLDTLAILTSVTNDLASLAPSRNTIYAYVNLAKLIQKHQPDRLKDRKLLLAVSNLLTTAIDRAKTIQDPSSEAQAIGALGNLYNFTGQTREARQLTERAIVIAEGLPAPDLAYRLQWQLGGILATTETSRDRAIKAYQQAIHHLKVLRNDLSASEADLQFSFRDSVEPVYRELVDLLLKDDRQITAVNLTAARDLIESLQVAQLENYLRQGCLDTYKVQLDRIDRSAAVIYPIILRDRVVVISALPNRELSYHSRSISETNVKNAVEGLRDKLDNYEFYAPQERAFQQQSQQIYDLLLAPIAADLQKSQTKTLVFVLDGALRNIPMSVLYDGNKYLVESFNLALTPGLQLVPPQSDRRQEYRAFLGGISEENQGFQPLVSVKSELDFISKLIPSQLLLNATFDRTQIVTKLVTDRSPIVHLATHGQFSSDPEQTFLLAWDTRLNLDRLSDLLQNRNIRSGNPIDLLVLSACETATGDRRATLGLAGIAIQARTRSTIASLWKVNDRATQILMTDLYQNLVTKKLGKAESLKLAQQQLIHNPKYRAPYYWGAFVLVGNWQ